MITCLAEAGVHKDEQDKVGLSSMFEIGQAMLAMIAHVNEQVDTKVDTPFPAYLRGHPELFIGIETPVLTILTKLLDHEKMFEGCDKAYHYMYAKLKCNSACVVEAFLSCLFEVKKRATCQVTSCSRHLGQQAIGCSCCKHQSWCSHC